MLSLDIKDKELYTDKIHGIEIKHKEALVNYIYYNIIDVICPNFPLCKINVLRGKKLLINMFDLWNKTIDIVHEHDNTNEGNLE